MSKNNSDSLFFQKMVAFKIKQQHARKYHCYFLVLKNNKRLSRRINQEN